MCVCFIPKGPNLLVIHLEKQTAVVDPVRNLSGRREKGYRD